MAPDGAIAMSVWSNIAACASSCSSASTREFHGRALEWGGGMIVGGHNYGQGSSREHAALAPVHLGVRAIAAGSYARIHRRNLIAVGIVPLVIGDDDRAAAAVGQRWHIPGLGAGRALRRGVVTATVDDGREITLGLPLSAGERAVLAAGGLLAHIRAGGRPPCRRPPTARMSAARPDPPRTRRRPTWPTTSTASPRSWAPRRTAWTTRSATPSTRANQTLRNIDWFEMTEVRGHLADGQVADWQVTVKIGFRLDDGE